MLDPMLVGRGNWRGNHFATKRFVMARLKAAVLGTGSIGDIHLAGYAASPDVEIAALCDVNAARLAEMGRKYGVEPSHLYNNYRDLLKHETLDLVSVCTPNVFHFEMASAAIKKGIPTLIEKPMTISLDDARRLRALAGRTGIKTMVAFSNRFAGPNYTAKRLLDRGAIGKPFMIRVRYAHGGPYPGWGQSDWFYKPALAGGGALLDMGIHAIDMCQFLIGPIRKVSAFVRTLRKPIKVDDNAVVTVDFGPKIKCLGYIECGWTSGPGFGGVEIYGDKGTLILDVNRGPVHLHGTTKPDGTRVVECDPIEVPPGPSHWPLQMESWIRYVQGKKTVIPVPTVEDGYTSLAAALAAVESSKTGRQITLR